MPAKVPMTVMGNAIEGMKVAETVRRKTKITPTTRRAAISSVICTSDTRIADGLAAVEEKIELHRSRQLLLHGGQNFADLIHDLDGVRARLALDGENDRALAVVKACHLVVLDAVDDRRHV